ncbi:MAG: nucleotidyltransferase domain-containing protein [Bacillota bacterium]|nr:nucleotidyltransferase domain-containing protein [Bacillota bacterium]
MPRTTARNALDNELIKEIVRRIVAVADPEKVILFGSYARGEQDEYSDVDIMVIKDSSLPRYRRAGPIRLALADLPVDKDIIVFTPQEEKEWATASTSLVATVLREGRVVYEKRRGRRPYRSATTRNSGLSAPMWRRP